MTSAWLKSPLERRSRPRPKASRRSRDRADRGVREARRINATAEQLSAFAGPRRRGRWGGDSRSDGDAARYPSDRRGERGSNRDWSRGERGGELHSEPR